MEAILHCNDLKCRALCPDQAVVTTCCHVFCLSCADRLGLTAPRDGQRKCPACKATLDSPDDAVLASLNPTEDYKTSILSGLNPTIIMEIAGRGLGFWNYQMAQEITYQDYLAKSLTERYHDLSAHLDNTIKGADNEMKGLELKLRDAQEELFEMRQKHEKLIEAYKEKSKNQQQTQKLYQTLKQQQFAAGIELAADTDAGHVLHENGGGRRADSGSDTHLRNYHHDEQRPRAGASDIWPTISKAGGNRSGMESSHAMFNQGGSGARSRPMQPAYGNFSQSNMGQSVQGNDGLRRGTPLRGSFAAIQPTQFSNSISSFGVPGIRKTRLSQEPIAGRTRASVARQSQVPGMRMR